MTGQSCGTIQTATMTLPAGYNVASSTTLAGHALLDSNSNVVSVAVGVAYSSATLVLITGSCFSGARTFVIGITYIKA
jgi:hypothetical protein